MPPEVAISTLLEQIRDALHPRLIVERELDRGGMGYVFKGRDPSLDRAVAIKVLRPELATEVGTGRFLREARILARISHPSVLAIYAAGKADGLLYYVMDFVESPTLKQRLADGPLAHPEVVKLGTDILAALSVVHGAGLIHRDVKPANVFLLPDRALLADFGVAGLIGKEPEADPLTQTNERVGTPGYMAPEQAAGLKTDARTDVYAVGEVLYESLTGRRWGEPGQFSMEGVPSALQPVLEKALSFSPSSRWQDSASMSEALANAYGKPTGSALPAAETGRRRLPRGVEWIAGAIAILGLTIGVVRVVGELGGGASSVAPADNPPIEPVAIAMLRCEDTSTNPEFKNIAASFSTLLMESLRRVPELRIKGPRGYSLAGVTGEVDVAALARRLEVAAILGCSIHEDGQQLRVIPRLYDVDGTELWFEIVETPLTAEGVFALEQAIVDATGDRLLEDWGSLSPDLRRGQARVLGAVDLYLAGLAAWERRTRESMEEAESLFDAAIQLDEQYARAWAGKAGVAASRSGRGYQPPRLAFEMAKVFAQKAIALDSGLAEAHAVLGEYYRAYAWDWRAADSSFARALQADRGFATAQLWRANNYLGLGRIPEAVAAAELAVMFDPVTPHITTGLAAVLFHAGHFEDAIVTARGIDPAFVEATLLEIGAMIFSGHEEQAREMLGAVSLESVSSETHRAGLAFAFAKLGNHELARSILTDLEDRWSRTVYFPPFLIAAAYGELGQEVDAERWLWRAYQEKDEFLTLINVSPLMESMRGHPTVAAIADSMGMAPR